MYVVIGEEFIAGLEHETDRVVESNNSVLRMGFTTLSQELPVPSRGAASGKDQNHYAVRHGLDVEGDRQLWRPRLWWSLRPQRLGSATQNDKGPLAGFVQFRTGYKWTLPDSCRRPKHQSSDH
jgi:hypothetical protein